MVPLVSFVNVAPVLLLSPIAVGTREKALVQTAFEQKMCTLRWKIILLIESVKAAIRLFFLVLNKGRMVRPTCCIDRQVRWTRVYSLSLSGLPMVPPSLPLSPSPSHSIPLSIPDSLIYSLCCPSSMSTSSQLLSPSASDVLVDQHQRNVATALRKLKAENATNSSSSPSSSSSATPESKVCMNLIIVILTMIRMILLESMM